MNVECGETGLRPTCRPVDEKSDALEPRPTRVCPTCLICNYFFFFFGKKKGKIAATPPLPRTRATPPSKTGRTQARPAGLE